MSWKRDQYFSKMADNYPVLFYRLAVATKFFN